MLIDVNSSKHELLLQVFVHSWIQRNPTRHQVLSSSANIAFPFGCTFSWRLVPPTCCRERLLCSLHGFNALWFHNQKVHTDSTVSLQRLREIHEPKGFESVMWHRYSSMLGLSFAPGARVLNILMYIARRQVLIKANGSFSFA